MKYLSKSCGEKVQDLKKSLQSSSQNNESLPFAFGSDGWDTPPSWLLENYITTPSVGFYIGNSQDLKTFIVTQIAFCVATGINFGGLKVSKGGVIFVCAEGANSFPRRLKAIEDKHNIEVGNNLVRIEEPISLLNTQNVDALESFIKKYIEDFGIDLKLIVLDTFSQCSAGIDENKAGDVAKYINACKTLSEKYSLSILITHHKNKDGNYRGSTALFGNSDFIIETKSENNKVENNKKVVRAHMSLKKSKDTSTSIAHTLEFNVVTFDKESKNGGKEKLKDNFGNIVTSLVFDKLYEKPTHQEKSTQKNDIFNKAIIDIIKSKEGLPISQKDITTEINSLFPENRESTNEKNVSNACRELCSRKIIEKEIKGRSNVYMLTRDPATDSVDLET
ncbi:AAA family ATPase [Pseudoalteromonas shioyasakiensis]|nr:AAA family ATPase [Pseudoalteromonas shioyasakiensis]